MTCTIRYISTQLQLSTPRTIVYIDESYIHHHYSRHNNSIYHPDDTASVPKKAKHKGRRLCFIAAIMSGGESDSKLLGLEIFEGGNRQPKDYHAMFTSEFFFEWFADLLDEIDKLQKYGVIFAMDNAKYHRTKPPDTPRGSMKKSELMAALQAAISFFDGVPTKPVVWASLKDFISRNIPAEVEKMATERGHVVAWTPPYHSDLQPIELVWSDVKGKVGRQYTATTSFEDVRRRLDSAFDELPSRTIYNCITHTENMVKEMNKYLEQLDEADDDAEESGDALSSDEVSDNSESDFENKE
ncbi:hypothetical protein LEN26_018811 [Aphanomyces euteiches]|nr:hypothetical protein LEN26_018811 [Aphanomyces euteiches]